jgi:hypothetical protein
MKTRSFEAFENTLTLLVSSLVALTAAGSLLASL